MKFFWKSGGGRPLFFCAPTMGITPTQFFLVLLEAVLDFYGLEVTLEKVYKM